MATYSITTTSTANPTGAEWRYYPWPVKPDPNWVLPPTSTYAITGVSSSPYVKLETSVPTAGSTSGPTYPAWVDLTVDVQDFGQDHVLVRREHWNSQQKLAQIAIEDNDLVVRPPVARKADDLELIMSPETAAKVAAMMGEDITEGKEGGNVGFSFNLPMATNVFIPKAERNYFQEDMAAEACYPACLFDEPIDKYPPKRVCGWVQPIRSDFLRRFGNNLSGEWITEYKTIRHTQEQSKPKDTEQPKPEPAIEQYFGTPIGFFGKTPVPGPKPGDKPWKEIATVRLGDTDIGVFEGVHERAYRLRIAGGLNIDMAIDNTSGMALRSLAGLLEQIAGELY